MNRVRTLLSLLVLGLLLLACAPGGGPSAQASAAPGKASWEAEWNKTLAAARQEGSVMLTTATGAEVATAIGQGLKDTYGIAVEAVAGNPQQLTAKMLAERRAGLYLRDVGLWGIMTPYTDLEPVGAIDPLDSTLIFPDVTDPQLIKKLWYRGQLWWVDKDHLVLGTLITPYPPLAVNTNLVKPGEIKSYNDLLDPKWKGKININDPSQSRTSFASFIMHLDGYGADWLPKLVKQEPTIMADERLQGDWLAHGKVAIALGIKDSVYMEFKRAAAPVQVVVPAEGTWLSAGSVAIFMLNSPPHPNATKVFINWLLTKEAQTSLSKLTGGHSTRLDVPTDFLEPWQIRQPGAKYWEKDRKEVTLQKPEELKLAKEIFASLYMK